MAVWGSGGAGWLDGRPLRCARPTIYSLPRIPPQGQTIGGPLISVPHVQTNEQRTAPALFRETRAANSDYLSFLFFWQCMEVFGADPRVFIADVMKNHRHQVPLEDSKFEDLPRGGRTIGECLYEDCRNAIAHVRRNRAGRKTFYPYKPHKFKMRPFRVPKRPSRLYE
jgi:hypothetical protein